jgi:hypothetical protein
MWNSKYPQVGLLQTQIRQVRLMQTAFSHSHKAYGMSNSSINSNFNLLSEIATNEQLLMKFGYTFESLISRFSNFEGYLGLHLYLKF